MARKPNNNVVASTHSKKATVCAYHIISGNPCEEARIKCLLMEETGMKYNTDFGVYKIVNVAVDLCVQFH